MYQISGVIADIQGISAGDAMIAAQDILNSLLKQFQELSNINSKPLHTTTMRSTGSQSFEMYSQRTDARSIPSVTIFHE
jgi:hypothetical protein